MISILRQEIQRGSMMLLADFSQMAVTGKYLVATQFGSRPRNGVVFPKADGGGPKGDGGGPHVASTFDDGTLRGRRRWRQSYGPLLFQHADFGELAKAHNPKQKSGTAGRHRESTATLPPVGGYPTIRFFAATSPHYAERAAPSSAPAYARDACRSSAVLDRTRRRSTRRCAAGRVYGRPSGRHQVQRISA